MIDFANSQGGTSTTGNVTRRYFLRTDDNDKDFLYWVLSTIPADYKEVVTEIHTHRRRTRVGRWGLSLPAPDIRGGRWGPGPPAPDIRGGLLGPKAPGPFMVFIIYNYYNYCYYDVYTLILYV